jgi:hypothetical protein
VGTVIKKWGAETGECVMEQSGLHMNRMTRRFALSPWRVSAFAIALLLPTATRSPAYQQPVPPPGQGSATDLRLTETEEKDSYDIYSILLRTEMPSQWNITGWAIERETQTYPKLWRDEQYRYVSATAEGPGIHL